MNEDDLDGTWDVLFDPETPYNLGMYDSSRDSVGAALLALGYDVNSDVETELNEAEQLLIDGDYYIFGEDNLKGLVIDGVLDMALVYSGDYFDELYYAEEEEIDITFGYYVPEITNIWVDAFVIPTISENTDMAYEFINFFLQEENAIQNADWVGYAPVLTETYDLRVSDEYGYDYDNYNPISEYGGWGIKGGFSKQTGKAYTTKGTTGLQLTLKNGKKILIGTQKKEEIKRVLETYKRKYTPNEL